MLVFIKYYILFGLITTVIMLILCENSPVSDDE